MPNSRRTVTFRVRFNDALFADDVAHARAEGQQIAREARRQLERDGAPADLLARCGGEHRDGTDLSGMVKLYLPMPYGDDWGLVLQGASDAAGPHLLVVAFGQRHPSRRPSVYDIAHHRRHGNWPFRTR